MAEPKQPLLSDVKGEFAALAADVRKMLDLRWQLARLELEGDYQLVRRVAVVFLVAGILALTALPLLAASLAEALDGWLGISTAGWLLIFGLGLLALGLAGAAIAWRHFRRRLAGLRQTLEELREDAVWLKEWAARSKAGQGP